MGKSEDKVLLIEHEVYGLLVRKKVNNYNRKFISSYFMSIHQCLIHRNIVKIYDIKDKKEGVIIDQEYCKFRSMNEVIEKIKLSQGDVESLITEVLKGLTFLNSKNLVHGDLKLSNILLQQEENDFIHKIGDLESCQEVGPINRKLKRCTPEIVAPEVLKANMYYFSSDVWSLGVLIFILFTGAYPFGRRGVTAPEVIKERRENCLYDAALLKSIPRLYRSIIKKTFELDPEKRASPEELLVYFQKKTSR